jgi:lipopolysaccharide export system protein LptC
MSIAANDPRLFDRLPSSAAVRRERTFRAAQRHSMVVRLLKAVLPFVAVSGTGLYVAPAVMTAALPEGKATVDAVEVSTGALKMLNPRMSGVHPQHGHYDVRADSSTPNLKTGVHFLDGIHAEVVSPSKETTTLVAVDGLFHAKEEVLLLEHGAVVTGTNGLWAKFLKADVSFKTHVVTTDQPVEMRFHDSVVTADTAEIFASESRIRLSGRVHVHLVRNGLPGGGASVEKPTAP